MDVIRFYAAALALLFVGLSVQVIRIRRRQKVAVGDGGDKVLLRAIRVQANFAEYVPLALLLILLLAQLDAAPELLHALSAVLLLSRVSHAYGVSQTPENFRFRVAGMMGTFTVLSVSALALLLIGF